MRYYAVTRSRGAAWIVSRPMAEQDKWGEHAAFMNALVLEGFVVLGGPIGDGTGILLVVDAGSEDAVRERLAADPWTPMQLLDITKIEPWQILLGG